MIPSSTGTAIYTQVSLSSSAIWKASCSCSYSHMNGYNPRPLFSPKPLGQVSLQVESLPWVTMRTRHPVPVCTHSSSACSSHASLWHSVSPACGCCVKEPSLHFHRGQHWRLLQPSPRPRSPSCRDRLWLPNLDFQRRKCLVDLGPLGSNDNRCPSMRGRL